MEFDVNKMKPVHRDGTHMYESKLLLEEVPWVQFNNTGMYFIPVDGERIWDPLFHKDLCIVGTVAGVNIQSKSDKIYVNEDDGSKLTDSDKKALENIGNTVITRCGLYGAYSDGTHAYQEYFGQLIEINYVIWFDDLAIGSFVVGNICRFLNSPDNVKMYETEIVPKLQPKPLLPMLIRHADESVKKIHKDVETLIEKERQAKTALTCLRLVESNQQTKGDS